VTHRGKKEGRRGKRGRNVDRNQRLDGKKEDSSKILDGEYRGGKSPFSFRHRLCYLKCQCANEEKGGRKITAGK